MLTNHYVVHYTAYTSAYESFLSPPRGEMEVERVKDVVSGLLIMQREIILFQEFLADLGEFVKGVERGV